MNAGEGERERALLAREVVELGEELFELALRGYAGPENVMMNESATSQALGANAGATFTEGLEREAYPVEELRAAAGEFFRVLRKLLDVEES